VNTVHHLAQAPTRVRRSPSSTSPILAQLFQIIFKFVALTSCMIPIIIQVFISGYIWLSSQMTIGSVSCTFVTDRSSKLINLQ
jgi:hypothetical protein